MSKMPTRVSVAGTSLSGAQEKTFNTSLVDALNTAGLQEGNRSTITASTTLTITQCGLVLADCTSGNVVLTLPNTATSSPSADDAIYVVRRLDNTTNTLVLRRGGSDTIEGATTDVAIGGNGIAEVQLPAGTTNWRVYGLNGATATAARNAISASESPFRNAVINGSILEDQRNAGASQTFTAAAALAYCVDRFYGYCTGANVSGQQVAAASGDGTKRYRFTGAASVSAVGFGHRIESANALQAGLPGNVCTLSAKLSNSLLTTVNWAAYYANSADTFGTLASPTRTAIASGSFTVSSTEATYSTQISVPTAASTGIEVVFTVGAQTSGTWTIGDVSLEKGSIPANSVSFERVDKTLNLARCQRYYREIPAAAINASAYLNFAAGNQIYQTLLHPVPMRAAPSLDSTTLTYNALNCASNPTYSSTAASVTATVLSVGTGNTYFIGTAGTLKLSAEL